MRFGGTIRVEKIFPPKKIFMSHVFLKYLEFIYTTKKNLVTEVNI